MTKKEKKQNKALPIILGILILGGAIFGFNEYRYFSQHIDTDDAQVDGDISPVIARVGGYVQDILFEENTHVNQGQELVILDDRDYKIKVEQAEAGQAGAHAGVGVSEAQIEATSANVSTAKANIEAAKVKLDLAQKEFERYAALVKDGAVTQQAFDQVKAQKETAAANYTAALDQYTALEKQVGTSRSQLTVSNSGVTQRQSEVDFAKLQLSYTHITAPAAGIVSKKNIQKGQLVQPGQALFSIVDTHNLYITANFKETQLEKLKPGLKVKIVVDAYPDEAFDGEVYTFAPLTGAKGSLLPPDNATGNFVKVVQRIPVKIKLLASEKEIANKLRPGMSVKVSVAI